MAWLARKPSVWGSPSSSTIGTRSWLGQPVATGTAGLSVIVRYLLVHELCHLFSMNHSRRFWNAVAQFEPDYRALDRRLTAAWALIPLWAQTREPPPPR